MSHAYAVKEFILREFLPGEEVRDLPDDYDLLRNGVVDSLGLLRLISWLEDNFEMELTDDQLVPETFRTVNAICGVLPERTAG